MCICLAVCCCIVRTRLCTHTHNLSRWLLVRLFPRASARHAEGIINSICETVTHLCMCYMEEEGIMDVCTDDDDGCVHGAMECRQGLSCENVILRVDFPSLSSKLPHTIQTDLHTHTHPAIHDTILISAQRRGRIRRTALRRFPCGFVRPPRVSLSAAHTHTHTTLYSSFNSRANSGGINDTNARHIMCQ